MSKQQTAAGVTVPDTKRRVMPPNWCAHPQPP